MPRDPLPLAAPDLSAFTKALAAQLRERPAPGHLSLMNMLARAAGYANVQQMRASRAAAARMAQPVPVLNHRLVERTLAQFDAQGRLMRWNRRQSVQDLGLWAFWARMPSGCALTEVEVNAVLNTWHLFGDPAILRRMLVTQGFMTRRIDGTDYRRLDRTPTPEAQLLLAKLSERRHRR